MRKTLVLLGGFAILLLANHGIYGKEQLLREGRVVLLQLAPVDPRSLMQGDYMALRFAVANAVSTQQGDGCLVLRVDAQGIGRFVGLDVGQPLAADELRLRYRIRGGRVRLASDAYFFQEGEARLYAPARYGELRVGADGEALLTGLRDTTLARLGH